MNYGLYLSASGVLTNSYRQDVFANNLANVDTPAFKREIPAIRQRNAEAVEARLSDQSNQLLDRLGGGAWLQRVPIDFEPGQLKRTNAPLDAAFETRDAFFVVRRTDPATGRSDVRLTRDGRFTRAADGTLVTVAGGFPVLGPGDQPIKIEGNGVVELDNAGRVLQNGQNVAQLQIAGVGDTGLLKKEGKGLYSWEGQADPRKTIADPTLRPGHIEGSGIDAVQALMDMIGATRAATGNANLIKYHDSMMDRAINTLGRVA